MIVALAAVGNGMYALRKEDPRIINYQQISNGGGGTAMGSSRYETGG